MYQLYIKDKVISDVPWGEGGGGWGAGGWKGGLIIDMTRNIESVCVY